LYFEGKLWQAIGAMSQFQVSSFKLENPHPGNGSRSRAPTYTLECVVLYT